MDRVFIISPAKSSGRRAELLFNPRAGFELAQAMQRGEQRPIGEVFSFLSGLYFRGKLAYAKRFGSVSGKRPSALVITSDRGLVPVDRAISLADLRAFSLVPIDEHELRYRQPLARDAAALAKYRNCEYVLLGSISTSKYVTGLLEILGERLLFPIDFVGRGDMSRGGLLLRSVRDESELAYQPVAGAIRRGKRPPKLAPASWKGTPWQK
ncbi:MAG TPA: hypothetical protein VFT72_00610 [Opitutaceae bacterium]|nr:hypothetical protein [Opitutaceae bacterium]